MQAWCEKVTGNKVHIWEGYLRFTWAFSKEKLTHPVFCMPSHLLPDSALNFVAETNKALCAAKIYYLRTRRFGRFWLRPRVCRTAMRTYNYDCRDGPLASWRPDRLILDVTAKQQSAQLFLLYFPMWCLVTRRTTCIKLLFCWVVCKTSSSDHFPSLHIYFRSLQQQQLL